MSDYTTNFPPQTYSSSFYLNSLVDDEKTLVAKSAISNGEAPTNPPLLDCFISTMTPSQLLVLLAFLHIAQSEQTTKQCLPKEQKIISFPSLTSYQASLHSFDSNHPSYRGNSVSFTFRTIDRLLRNSFISFGSDSIIEIDLEGKQIQNIEEGAFNSLFCLHFLKLRRNNLTVLTENVFQGLGNLRLLDLSENSLERIDGLVFRDLNNLDTLYLSRNKIRTLSGFAFANLTSLTVLDLSFNQMRSLDPNSFTPLASLKKLYLNNNRLKDFVPETLFSLMKLQVLDLAQNGLNSFDASYRYAFTLLENLNLSGNYISYLDGFGLRKNFPKLKVLDITDNDWLCENLEVLKHQLADSNVELDKTVNCSVSGVYKRRTTEGPVVVAPPTSTSTSTSASATKKTRDYSKEVFVQNGEILFTNQKVLENVQHLENVIVCLFVVVIMFVIIEMGVRIGICHNLYSRMTGRYQGYLDGTDREDMMLRGH